MDWKNGNLTVDDQQRGSRANQARKHPLTESRLSAGAPG